MTWSRIDHAFRDHPKIDGLSHGAFRLHWNAILYSGQHLTDGVVEASRPARLMPGFKKSYVDELVTAGLWDRHGKGWVIHGYLEFQQSAEDARARTEAKAAAGRAGGIKSGQARKAKREAPASTKPEAAASPDASQKNEARHVTTHLNKSSSSSPLVRDPSPDDEEELSKQQRPVRSAWPDVVLEAATLHATEALAVRCATLGPVASTTSWLRTAQVNWLADKGALAQRLAEQDPNRDPADLVRLCAAVDQPKPPRPPCDACRGLGHELDEHGDEIWPLAPCPACKPSLKLVTGGNQ